MSAVEMFTMPVPHAKVELPLFIQIRGCCRPRGTVPFAPGATPMFLQVGNAGRRFKSRGWPIVVAADRHDGGRTKRRRPHR